MWLFISLLLVFLIIIVLIRIPAIQTKITKYAITYITGKTHTKVELDKIRITFPKSVVIEGLYLEDLNKDTLLYAEKIKVNISLKGILENRLRIRSVALEDAYLNLYNTKKDSIFNYGFLLTAFSDSTKQPKPEDAAPWIISLDKVTLSGTRARYRDQYSVVNNPDTKNAFNPSNLYFTNINLKATDIYYSAEKTEVKIRNFSATDQNNFSILEMETEFRMDSQSITARKLKIKTNGSSIEADLSLSYPSLATIMDSIPLLVLNLDMKSVNIMNSDILYFSPGMDSLDFFKNSQEITFLSGTVTGAVNNLSGKKVVIRTGKNTELKTDFEIKGLPDIKTAYFNFPNLEIVSGSQDINLLAGSLIPASIELPKELSLQIDFKGGLKSFETNAGLKSSFGAAQIFASIDQNENFKADAKMSNFNVGRLLRDTKMFGPVTLKASTVGKGLDLKTIRATIKADASQIYLNSYNYHNLKIDGKIHGSEFEGKINLKDENAVLDFDGLVNLNPEQERYKFTLNVPGADLKKLHLTKDDIRIGLTAMSDLEGGTPSEITGSAGISNIIIIHEGRKYVLDSLLVVSVNAQNKSDLTIRSSLIGVKYSGKTSPIFLPAAIKQFIGKYFPFAVAGTSKPKAGLSDFNFEIALHNHPILSEVFLPQLKEFVPGLIKGSFDSQTNNLKIDAAVKKIVYGSMEVRDLALVVNSDINALNYSLSCLKISSSQFRLDNFLLDGKLADNVITANLSSIDDKENKKLVVRSRITKQGENYRIQLDPKEFYLMNDRWDIAAGNFIETGKQGFRIHDLFMNKNGSQINIASAHELFNDDLSISIKNFKLGDVSRIFEKDTTLVQGNIDGNLLLKRVSKSYGIIADATISNLIIKEVPIGNLALKADNPTAEKFDIDLKLSGADNNLTAKGYYIPNGGDNAINIRADIQSLAMKTIELFSKGEISESAGMLSGNFQITGNTNAPGITGEAAFKNVFFKPAFLNNRLEIKDETIQFQKDGIYFKSFTLNDIDQHAATIDGTILMQKFSNLVFNLQLNAKDFLLFNTTKKDNKEFNGRMIIDSRVDVSGPMSLPVINARIKIKKGSNFTFAVPEDKLTTDKGEDVIVFSDTVTLDPILSEGMKKQQMKSSFTGIDLSSIIEIDKQATLKLLMDPASTDSLVVRGEAALSFALDRSGKMSLTGAYNLSEGSYLISMESIIKRKFDIVNGSTIIWNGDPLDADISINAAYSVRASPYDLVADQMSGLSEADKGSYKQRYPFIVFLKLRGEILHPVISFEIQLEPEDKGILGGVVFQKLNMLNEDASALNKQVFALLVLGRFVQENPLQTESAGPNTLIRSTVGKFLSAQLNQLTSKVIPGVGLNFDIQSYNDFQSGQAQGRTQVEIGLKKELFNERLSVQVGGSVDVEGEMAKQNKASEITGDVTVEYKLTKDGRYRLKAFRHNQYEGAIEGQLVETGAGVMYLRDFNKWKEVFTRKKKSNETIND